MVDADADSKPTNHQSSSTPWPRASPPHLSYPLEFHLLDGDIITNSSTLAMVIAWLERAGAGLAISFPAISLLAYLFPPFLYSFEFAKQIHHPPSASAITNHYPPSLLILAPATQWQYSFKLSSAPSCSYQHLINP